MSPPILPPNARWYLQSFDPVTDFLIEQYLLVGIDGSGLKVLLNLDDSEAPVEHAQHPVEPTDLPKLFPYLVDSSVVDPSLNYDVAVSKD